MADRSWRRFSAEGDPSPLEPHKKSIQVLGGLNHRTANGGRDGAGDHARGNGTFLTGVRLKKSATDIRAGVSIDQVIARQIGQLTRFPSLELATDAIHRAGPATRDMPVPISTTSRGARRPRP